MPESTSACELVRVELWCRSQEVRITGVGFRGGRTAVAMARRVGDGCVHMLRGIKIRGAGKDFMRRLSLWSRERWVGPRRTTGYEIKTVDRLESSGSSHDHIFVR